MTKQEIVRLVDDLDGETAHETVTFGLDGKTYEIDLSNDHAATLREGLSPYAAAARRPTTAAPTARSPRQRRTDADGPRSRSEAQAMRSWARQSGFELADRGRIPATIVQAYRDADNATAAAPKPAPVPSSPPRAATGGPPATTPEPTDADVLAWHEAKNYKIPANRTVNGLMRHRYRTAHEHNE